MGVSFHRLFKALDLHKYFSFSHLDYNKLSNFGIKFSRSTNNHSI